MYCIRFCGGTPPAKREKKEKIKGKRKEKKKGCPAQFPAWTSTKSTNADS
jgi:hypothetical protein